MVTELRAGALAFVLIGAAVFAFWQHQQIERLTAERAVLRVQVGEAASQRDEIQRLAAQVKATVESSEADRGELMRLRAQSSKLRQVEQENIQLKIERQRLASLVAQAKQASALSDQQQQKLPTSDVKAPSTPTGVTDLGVIELSDATPMRLDLGEGKECVVTTTVLDDGQLQMVFTFESEIDGVPIQTKQTATVLPGRQIAKIIGGVEIALTPTRKIK
jgi:hypothetical protein